MWPGLKRNLALIITGRIDTHFPLEKRPALMDFVQKNPPAALLRSPLAEIKAYDGVKLVAHRDSSWLMLRGSGTEPILRIYAEAKSRADAEKLLRVGVQIADAVNETAQRAKILFGRARTKVHRKLQRFPNRASRP